MTIAEFNAKVRIGTWVLYKRHPYRVEDVDRREHAAIIRKYKRVRCSELTFLGESPEVRR